MLNKKPTNWLSAQYPVDTIRWTVVRAEHAHAVLADIEHRHGARPDRVVPYAKRMEVFGVTEAHPHRYVIDQGGPTLVDRAEYHLATFDELEVYLPAIHHAVLMQQLNETRPIPTLPHLVKVHSKFLTLVVTVEEFHQIRRRLCEVAREAATVAEAEVAQIRAAFQRPPKALH